METELNKQTIADPKDIGQELDEPELPINREEAEPIEARESFMIELPSGYKVASQSCILRADQLAQLVIDVFHTLKNQNGNKETKETYFG